FVTDLNIDRILDDLRQARLSIGDDLEKVNRYLDRLRSELTSKSPESLRAYLEHQTYIALGFAMLAAKERGIDSCPMGGFIEEEYRKILGIPDDMRVTVLLPLGYTEPRPIRKIRKKDVIMKNI
ncbi:MAG: nitroreductase family protein, partial [Candidatus Micrarchaeota archaeon]|nr:nitroreductase family protein [Candidatus Micrarchaeota archaeon]